VTKRKAATGERVGGRRRVWSREERKQAMASLEEERNKILNLESEEDRKILMKVKSEEGKILKLKKEYAAAALAGLFPPTVPTVMEAQPAGKKTKKVLVKRLVTMTKAQIDFIKAMATHPCPTRNLTEDQLAMHPKSFQYSYRQDIRIRNTRLAYMRHSSTSRKSLATRWTNRRPRSPTTKMNLKTTTTTARR
jgi:hypothetical protein